MAIMMTRLTSPCNHLANHSVHHNSAINMLMAPFHHIALLHLVPLPPLIRTNLMVQSLELPLKTLTIWIETGI